MLKELIGGAGILIYPLAACSFFAIYIICERLYALRKDAILPDELVDSILEGRQVQPGRHSVMARIVGFSQTHQNDPAAVKAFARLELNRMERGIPYLDVIYITAPLLGLTGTVYGLLQVFQSVPKDTGIPDPATFMHGVSLALSATLLGLIIAMVALVPGNYLQRTVDNYAAKIDLLLERLLSRNGTQPPV